MQQRIENLFLKYIQKRQNQLQEDDRYNNRLVQPC